MIEVHTTVTTSSGTGSASRSASQTEAGARSTATGCSRTTARAPASRACRSSWNGQTNGDHAFSVAQHSLVVETIFRRQNRCDAGECLIALLHDAPEYVIGDMISPFKAVVGGGYKSVEKRLETAVHLRFGLPAATPAALKARFKKADQVAAFFEATELAGFSHAEATKFFGAPRGITLDMIEIAPLPAVEAQARFAARFAALERERGAPAASA